MKIRPSVTPVGDALRSVKQVTIFYLPMSFQILQPLPRFFHRTLMRFSDIAPSGDYDMKRGNQLTVEISLFILGSLKMSGLPHM